MIRHYYTLCKIAEELRRLRGMFLTECFTQDKGVAVLSFELPSTREAVFVESSTDVQHGSILIRPQFHRARKNTIDFFPSLIGHTLQDVRVADNERIVSLEFAAGTLHCVLFGGKQAAGYESGGNLILTDAGQTILAAFKGAETLAGKPFALARPTAKSIAAFAPETPLLVTLSQCDILLGKIYAAEALHRLATRVNASFEELTTLTLAHVLKRGWLDAVEECAHAVRSDCLQTEKSLLYRDAVGKPFVSLIPLTGYSLEREFDSISEALRTRIALGQREQTFHARRASIVEALRSRLHKAQRTLQHLENDRKSDERASERQLFAELLLSQPNINAKGAETITLQTWDGEDVTIALNPALTLRENADGFFAKARTAREAAAVRRERKAQYEREAAQAQAAFHAVEAAENLQSLERVMAEFSLQQPSGASTGASSGGVGALQKTHKYREFDLGEGYTLYVGKAAADNDELTLRFAKPQDYWFHARGVAGSHAVLKSPQKDKKPPKYVLETAASIAAYYSKARNAKLTPVAYTQKKYIRKPKGAAPGAVMLEREEVVMARPQLPATFHGETE